MKQRSLPYVSIFIYILFGLFSLFLIPHSAVAQNADCNTLDPHLRVPVYFYDQRGVKWGETGNACVTSQGANITRISGINNTYFTCNENGGTVVGAFISRSYRCVAGTMVFDIQAPPNFDCSKSTWRYLGVANGFGIQNNTESSSGSGCRVTVPYPPGDFQRQIIITINLPDPVRLAHTCNNNGTVTLRWNSVAGATEYGWRLNNRVNPWYTASTDSYGYTGSTSVNVPMQYGASYDWAVTATNSAGKHPFPSSWSAAFTCPALTPTPFINIQTRNAQGSLAPVRGIAYTYNCGTWPVCFTSAIQYVSSATINAIGGWQGGAGIALNSDQRLLGVTPAPAGGALNTRSNGRASPWQDNVTWNNYWWASYPTTGSRTVNFVVATMTPTPTPFCRDYDGGNVPNTSGNAQAWFTNGTNNTLTDACDLSSPFVSGSSTYRTRVNEYSCQPPVGGGSATGTTRTSSSIACVAGRGCLNGACVCMPVSAPTNLRPNGTIAPGPQAIQWNAASGAARYALRVNDRSNGWTGSCVSLNPGDVCTNVTGTSFTYNFIAGRSYTIWVHTISACDGTYSAATFANATVPPPTPTPTATPTNTPTPTPTPAYWYKLKDASLNKRVAAPANVKVPNPALAYDADDTTASQLIIEQAGVISSNYNLTPINGGTFSTKAWYKGSYALNNPYIQDATTLNTFKNSLISSKDIKTITTIANAEANKVNIREGNLTINTAIPNGPYVIFVNGNIYVNGPLPVFNSTSQSIALIATGSIFIHQNLTGANGIFIAPQVVLASSGIIVPQQPPLKINGNIISTNQVITTIRQSTDQNRPSFFVVFKPKMYLDLLPLLSTVVQEGRQLE